MSAPGPTGRTSVSVVVPAPRGAVFRACLDREALQIWRAPDGMVGHVHLLEPRAGGRIRMSLVYTDPDPASPGKSGDDTDTYEGVFTEIRTNEKIVEIVCFVADDPAFAGEMTITTSFADAQGGTRVTYACEGIPPGIAPADNEDGTRQSLAKLVSLFELAMR